MKIKKSIKLSEQIKRKISRPKEKDKPVGNTEHMISTGSTLLDLAITGGRVEGGGLPGGVLVEVFGPSGCGKTVLLCEIAGAVQRQRGQVMFHDPEARLNKQFARIFDLDTDEIDYNSPDKVPQVFKAVRDWNPVNLNTINCVCADSLAALSTDLEVNEQDGDKMGMRRAKEFSQELRKTCRVITNNNYLVVCSNQIRQSVDGFEKYVSPGGKAIGFYSSVRLRAKRTEKITKKKKFNKKDVSRVVGVRTEFEVYKNSCWKPYRTAWLTILFDYGIDDVRENLQFIKDHTGSTVYTMNNSRLSDSKESAINVIETRGLEQELRNQVIRIWNEIEQKFNSERKKKQR